MSPQQLSEMLDPGAGWASHVEAARRAEAAKDAELIPAMFAGFVAAKRGTLREDPDIHERLLYALEAFGVGEVVPRLKGSIKPPEIGVRVGDYHAWLDAIAADERGLRLLRVVQGDGLNMFIDGGGPPTLPIAGVGVPGGDVDLSRPLGSFAIPPDKLPRHPDATWPWILLGSALFLGGVIVAGRRAALRPAVFRILAVSIAPLGVLVLEASLTLSGVEPLSSVRPNFNLGSDRVGMRWFEPVHGDVERVQTVKNNARHQVFSAKKPAGLVRIVALGGSSVRGKGDIIEYSWPSVLERRLRACSGARVQVINAGADGALSDDLVVVARNFADYDPDLYVVYAGYNDFVFVPLLTRFEGYSPARMGLRYALGRTRTAHLVLRWTGRLDSPREAAGGIASVRSDRSVSDMRLLLADNLSQNLRRVARTARDAGAEVIFVTQGQNEELCGEGSLNGQSPWEQSCFPREARRTILQAAAAENVTVVDAAAALREATGRKTVGWSHFWDEIHPGRAGSSVIGEAIAPTAMKLLWPGVAAPDGCSAGIPAL
jgi:lysophospholipase L1-like esterase